MTLPHTRNLFLAAEGPSLDYGDGTLFISDLNPQIETQWRMSRFELFMLGMRCIGEALEAPRNLPECTDRRRFVVAMLAIALVVSCLFALFLSYSTPTRPTVRVPGEKHARAGVVISKCSGPARPGRAVPGWCAVYGYSRS